MSADRMAPRLDDAAPDVNLADPADLVAVRVWEFPVRLCHWTLVGSIMVLTVTGFLIGTPILRAGSSTGFMFGWTRAIHLVAAWVFTLALVVRLAWMFAGNQWARWDQFVPLDRERRGGAMAMLRYYLFVRRDPPPAVGHNPLAGATYLVVYVMLLSQAVTGFALAGLASREGVIWWLTGWVFNVAPIPVIRLTHHLVMWLILGFTVHHVYSATLIDVEERNGTLSSIVTGWKRVPRNRS